MMEDEFITVVAFCDLTGLSKSALGQLRYKGGGPRFYKPTKKTVLYKRSEVVAWIEASAHERTSSPSFA